MPSVRRPRVLRRVTAVVAAVLLGLVSPTAGTCRILGADSGHGLHRVIKRVGALIETPGLTPTLSGRRNLALLARLDRIGASGVERALRDAGLDDRADDPVAAYSLGMRQRLGIAAALLRDPEVVILDEPANGLDRLLDEMCVDLGFCLPPEDRATLRHSAERRGPLHRCRLLGEGT